MIPVELIKEFLDIINTPTRYVKKKCEWCGGFGLVNKFKENPLEPYGEGDWDGTKDCPKCSGKGHYYVDYHKSKQNLSIELEKLLVKYNIKTIQENKSED